MLSLLSLEPEKTSRPCSLSLSQKVLSHKDHFLENTPGPKWSSPDKPLLHILANRPTNFRVVPRQHRQLLSFLLKVTNVNINITNINIISVTFKTNILDITNVISITFNINITKITNLTITLLKIKHHHYQHHLYHIDQYHQYQHNRSL